MPAGCVSSVSKRGILPLRTGIHGPLGSENPRGAVLFSGDSIRSGSGEWRSGAGPLSYVRWVGLATGRRPRPPLPAASPSRGPAIPQSEPDEFIFDTADAVLAVDREQRIVLWNEGATALLGFAAKEVLGRFCHEVLGGRDDSGRVVCQASCPDLMKTLRRERVRSCDLLVRTKTSREIWVSVFTLRVPSRWEDLGVLVHLFHDVTRQKEVEGFVEQIRSSVAKLSFAQGTDPPPTLRPFPSPVDLTRREREVLRLLASGCSTDSVAEKLFISPATARNHIRHLLGKLGVHSRLEAVTLALRTALMYVALIAGSCIPCLPLCF
jgi:PAS domain S-box-containing protein